MKDNTKCLHRKLTLIVIIGMLSFAFGNQSLAQDRSPYVRIVTLVINSPQLESFKAALKEDIESAVATEPGVLSLYAVYDKDRPIHVTIFEIYANEAAHKAHQQTPHFLKYKNATKGMVKSVVRTEVIPIALEAKSKQ